VAGGVDVDLVRASSTARSSSSKARSGGERDAQKYPLAVGQHRNRRRRTCRSSRSRTSTAAPGRDEKLTSYGWVDKEGGVTRLPIDRAMEVMLEKGFPARTKAATR
jgi:hypothetical protein